MTALDESLPARFATLRPLLDERTRRIWAAVEARAMGRGGISKVSEATGLSRTTIRAGLKELAAGPPKPRGRVRRPGGVRKPAIVKDPELTGALERKLDPVARGGPKGPLWWTCRSSETLAEELRADGHDVSGRTVNRLLHRLGYRLRANRRTLRGKRLDRDEQFEHINRRVQEFHAHGQPVIWVDVNKRVFVARDQAGEPLADEPGSVVVRNLRALAAGKATAYSASDLTANTGWTSVEVDRDTAEFAAEVLGRWWPEMSRRAFPAAERILVAAEDGGSNNGRGRVWTAALQGLADKLGLQIAVCHVPPGTSKWTKIQNRMFCHTRQNWSGQQPVGHEVMVNLIGAVTPRSGLSVRSGAARRKHETARGKASTQVSGPSVKRDAFHGEWNYTVRPRR